MKNKITKVLAMIIVASMITVTLVGCGAKNKEVADMTEVENSVVETESKEVEIETEEVEETEEKEPTYTEEEDIFVMKTPSYAREDYEMDMSSFKDVIKDYTFEKETDIYFAVNLLAGYTKSGITATIAQANDEWCLVQFANGAYLVKNSDIGFKFEEPKKEEPKKETPKKEESKPTPPSNNGGNSNGNGNSSNGGNNEQPAPTPAPAPEPKLEPTPEPPAPEPTPNYSDGEVIGIVESTLRGAGCKKPEEVYPADIMAIVGPTNGMGWGENKVSKTNPQADANSLLDFMQTCGYNLYYIETIDSDANSVTIRLYSGTM